MKKIKDGKKRLSAKFSKRAQQRRRPRARNRVDLSAQMTNYLLEPHPEFGV